MPRRNMTVSDACHRRKRRRATILAALVCLVIAAFLMDVITGPAAISLRDLVTTLFQPQSANGTQRVILWSFRLPTAAMAVLVGGSLGLAGGQMQTILNNPLASPYTLGISAAAGFGAALVLVFGLSQWGVPFIVGIPAGAFLSAIGCALILYMGNRFHPGNAETLIVGGVALHFLFSSGLAFLQYRANSDSLQAIVFWTFGSLQGVTWPQVSVLFVSLTASILLISPYLWQLTTLKLGDDYARSLGVDVDRVKLRTMLIVSVLTATAVCFTGAIGFVGLIAPHLARMLVGEDQRFLIAVSLCCGAFLVSLADIVSKSLLPGTILPIGIVTAAVGAPLFAIMAFRHRGRQG